jgi:hypothetical protein
MFTNCHGTDMRIKFARGRASRAHQNGLAYKQKHSHQGSAIIPVMIHLLVNIAQEPLPRSTLFYDVLYDCQDIHHLRSTLDRLEGGPTYDMISSDVALEGVSSTELIDMLHGQQLK